MKKYVVPLSLILAGAAAADGALTPAHGGRMVEAAGYRLELVTGAGQVALYVTDHGDKPVAVDKAHGKVTVLAGPGKVEIALAPAGGNRLAGEGAVAGDAAVIAVEGLDKRIAARLAAGVH